MPNLYSLRPLVTEVYAVRHDNRTRFRVEVCLLDLVEGVEISLIVGFGFMT